jgi:hypothetical protein
MHFDCNKENQTKPLRAIRSSTGADKVNCKSGYYPNPSAATLHPAPDQVISEAFPSEWIRFCERAQEIYWQYKRCEPSGALIEVGHPFWQICTFSVSVYQTDSYTME